MDIRIKSTGQLIDEYITTTFKIEISPTPENIQRAKLLHDSIERTLVTYKQDVIEHIGLLIDRLRLILRECWNAQEIIMDSQHIVTRYPADINAMTMLPFFKIAEAAVKAQKTNAQRNKVIRDIDRVLGEQDITTLEKTYS